MTGVAGAKVLVVGGTGPTGPAIVDRFLASGAAVTIYHSGTHEAEFNGPVTHLHGDPREPADIHDKVGAASWDIAVLTSGRLRALATELSGKARRVVGITGQPVYSGTMVPTPGGRLPLPIPEHAERQRDATNYTGKVAEGEDQLFEQHQRGDFEAVIVRYPGVYGPRGPLSHEWAVVKRVLDRRPAMVLPHDGLTYFQRGYAENLGHLVFLAATVPAAAGEAFNAGDERVMSGRAVAEAIADELGHPLQFVGIPAPACRGFYPLAQKSSLILDMTKARTLLGYRDVLDAEPATRLTARWLAEHQPVDISPAFGGSFDYAAEDRLIAEWTSPAPAPSA